MKLPFRIAIDRFFTGVAIASAVFLCLILVVILGPMIRRGTTAVIFKGTVEFRRMQLSLHGRGNQERIDEETAQARILSARLYEYIESFKRGVDTEALRSRARQIHRAFGQELRYKGVQPEQYTESRAATRRIRDRLEEAFASYDREIIKDNIEYVLGFSSDERFENTAAAEFFAMAAEFKETIKGVDLAKLDSYKAELGQVEDLLKQLLGPRPDEPLPALTMYRYGATRWDTADRLLDRLIWTQEWVQQEPGKPLVMVRSPRKDRFAGTALSPLFENTEEKIKKILQPKIAFYWQYFLDDSTPGHYFGGVGPEIIGTLILTLLSMLFAVPLGVTAAAYLSECSSDNRPVRVIRMCINTLAGVPSIVFGLFGLAFFVLYLFPLVGLPSKPCLLAASLTLAVLTLPVIIRASEEAIRAVPETYKEASLGLGASRFRTFLTVILPAAMPGILTGVILSLSRVAGETAPILFTGAVALGPIPKSVFEPARTLSYGSYDIAVGDRLAMMVPHQQYGMVVTLVLLILFLNTVAILMRSRMFKKLQGR
jgi:phosphate transport system permease protein